MSVPGRDVPVHFLRACVCDGVRYEEGDLALVSAAAAARAIREGLAERYARTSTS